MSKTTINRIINTWEKVCISYEPKFEFPESEDDYDGLEELYRSEQDLKSGMSKWIKIIPRPV